MSKPRLMNEAGDVAAETSPLLSPVGFSLAEWVSGRGRATRSVRIYGAFSLFAEREKAGEDLDVALSTGDSDRADVLRAQIKDLTERMQADYVDFKLQALTASRRQELSEELTADTDADPVDISARMLAEYVVEPEGQTPDDLLALAEWDENQAAKLLAAMNDLNTTTPNIEGSRPF